MSSFYKSRMGKTLGQKLEELKASEKDRLQLSDEVDLARVLCADAVSALDLVEEKSEQLSAAAKEAVRKNLKQSLSFVAYMVKAATNVKAAGSLTTAPGHTEWLIANIGRIILDEIKDEALVERINKRISEIPLPAEDLNPRVTISLE